MGVDNQLLAALKRQRAQAVADGMGVSDVDDELAAARGLSQQARKIRKRAAATVAVEVPVADVSVAETAD